MTEPLPRRRTRERSPREQSRARIVAAATELVRRRGYAELSVEDVMREAGLGRTIFYRHFTDLGDLIAQTAGEAIEELFEAEQAIAAHAASDPMARVGEVIDTAVSTFVRHGPLLRAVAEAAAADPRLAAGRHAIRARFDEITAEALAELPRFAPGSATASAAEVARALNLMNEAYLLDAYGREPRLDPAQARATLTAIWSGVLR